MIRIDADNAVVRIYKSKIPNNGWEWELVYNELLQDANALRLALNKLTTARWTVEIVD